MSELVRHILVQFLISYFSAGKMVAGLRLFVYQDTAARDNEYYCNSTFSSQYLATRGRKKIWGNKSMLFVLLIVERKFYGNVKW